MSRIKIVSGDITKVHADAIVNAANSSLTGGGGVDGAIHRVGGPAILEACRKFIDAEGRCNTGDAVVTTAGNLPARIVIHTVGPVWKGGSSGEEELLSKCYLNSLKRAAENDCKTIAFPCISTGAYCYPEDRAALVSVKAVSEFLSGSKVPETVMFVCFDEVNKTQLERVLKLRVTA